MVCGAVVQAYSHTTQGELFTCIFNYLVKDDFLDNRMRMKGDVKHKIETISGHLEVANQSRSKNTCFMSIRVYKN